MPESREWCGSVECHVRGKPKLIPPCEGIGPSRRDRFLAREEVESLRTVRLGVAEDAVLEPAERVIGHRDRDRHVDADHADLDVPLEAPTRAAVIGEDCGSIAERAGVDQVHAFLIRLDADDAQHRTEDLVACTRGWSRAPGR